jgi:hypothetical protein
MSDNYSSPSVKIATGFDYCPFHDVFLPHHTFVASTDLPLPDTLLQSSNIVSYWWVPLLRELDDDLKRSKLSSELSRGSETSEVMRDIYRKASDAALTAAKEKAHGFTARLLSEALSRQCPDIARSVRIEEYIPTDGSAHGRMSDILESAPHVPSPSEDSSWHEGCRSHPRKNTTL